MYKLRAVCLFLLLSLYPYNADAKVCFLPGVLAGDGCMVGEVVTDCDGYTRTTPCPSNYNSETCKKNGRTYYKCTCKSGNYAMPSNDYICRGDYDATCGCAAEHTYCNTRVYPFESCGEYSGTYPSAADSCVDPADRTPHYKSCGCSETLYPYDCKEKGLKESKLASKCTDSTGKSFYSFCDCADSWTTEPCSENSTGCTRMLDNVDRGGGLGYCYSCGTEICPVSGNRNLAGYFCSVTPTTTTDCQALGYTTLDKGDGLCSDGTKGMKCIFNSKYLFCEKSDDCPYPTKKWCLRFNKYSNCVQGRNGCWKPEGCAQGYHTSVEGCVQTDITYVDKCGSGEFFYTKLAGQDSNGCGYCSSEYSSCSETPYQYTCSATDEYNYQNCYLYATNKGEIKACCEEKHKFYETCEAAGMYDYDARDDIDIYSGVYMFTQKVGLMGKTCYKNICEGVPEATCDKDFTPTCTAKGWVVYGECKCTYETETDCIKAYINYRCGQGSNGCWYIRDCAIAGYYDYDDYSNVDKDSGLYVPISPTIGKVCYTKLCSGTPRSECSGTFTKTCTGVDEDYGTCSQLG